MSTCDNSVHCFGWFYFRSLKCCIQLSQLLCSRSLTKKCWNHFTTWSWFGAGRKENEGSQNLHLSCFFEWRQLCCSGKSFKLGFKVELRSWPAVNCMPVSTFPTPSQPHPKRDPSTVPRLPRARAAESSQLGSSLAITFGQRDPLHLKFLSFLASSDWSRPGYISEGPSQTQSSPQDRLRCNRTAVRFLPLSSPVPTIPLKCDDLESILQ